MKHNTVQLSFCIWGFEDISHDDISKKIGHNPTKIHEKGKRINPKYPKEAKENGWFLDYPGEGTFEIQMNYFLNLILEKKESFSKICKEYVCEFSCAVHIDNVNESTPWIHLDRRFCEVMKDLNIEFDFDIYV